MKKTIPAISVIIPMYNTEKYIGQCLHSLLSQTFQDYEVIIVDDCSTDNSVKIVEEIAPRFKKRLQLMKLDKNCGAAAIPRNTAMKLARGKYLFFLDADDIIVNNAFEILYNVAQKTNADVVHVEKNLIPIGESDIIDENTRFKLDTHQAPPFVDKITIETKDISNRIERFCQRKFFWWACSKLFRREFLIENKIEFLNLKAAEDLIFSFCCLCHAKNYVRIPEAIYIYRQSFNSVTHTQIPVDKRFQRNVQLMIKGIKAFDRIFDDIKIENPEYRYMAINFLIRQNLWGESGMIYSRVPLYILDSLMRKEFANESKEECENLLRYFYSAANIFCMNLVKAQKNIVALQEENQKLLNKPNTPPFKISNFIVSILLAKIILNKIHQ